VTQSARWCHGNVRQHRASPPDPIEGPRGWCKHPPMMAAAHLTSPSLSVSPSTQDGARCTMDKRKSCVASHLYPEVRGRSPNPCCSDPGGDGRFVTMLRSNGGRNDDRAHTSEERARQSGWGAGSAWQWPWGLGLAECGEVGRENNNSAQGPGIPFLFYSYFVFPTQIHNLNSNLFICFTQGSSAQIKVLAWNDIFIHIYIFL
jgi:hypothetical protein